MIDRIDHIQILDSPVSQTGFGKCTNHPECPVGILTAVLPYSGDVAPDVTGIPLQLVERWRQQADDPVIHRDQPLLQGMQRLRSPICVCHTGDHRPGLGDRIDLALFILIRTERRTVIKKCPEVPLPVPSVLIEAIAEPFCKLSVPPPSLDRKSTRLNSSHVATSYAVFCSKKKNK